VSVLPVSFFNQRQYRIKQNLNRVAHTLEIRTKPLFIRALGDHTCASLHSPTQRKRGWRKVDDCAILKSPASLATLSLLARSVVSGPQAVT
jgi:hypothetical protein